MLGSRPMVIFEGDILVPSNVGSLETFRRWSLSEEFPESGRIDFLDGTVEVEMSPEDSQTHGQPKSILCAYISKIVSSLNLGQVFVDRMRFRSKKAELSCEPDLMYVSWNLLESGKARFVPSSTAPNARTPELEGSVDLVVEIVSDSSVEKDTRRLPPLYAKAGVSEFWLVDARSAKLTFEIFHLKRGKWRAAAIDSEGYQMSEVFDRAIRLNRKPGKVQKTWIYFVEEK